MQQMRGKCIDSSGSSNLKVGEIYYLLPHGGTAYGVSRFPRSSSHFGTYQKSRFVIVTEDVTNEDVRLAELRNSDELPVLEAGKVYEAELMCRKAGYSTPLV